MKKQEVQVNENADLKTAKKQIRIGTIILVLIVLVTIGIVCFPSAKTYVQAKKYVFNEQYVEAGKLFHDLGGFLDSKGQYRKLATKLAQYGKVGDALVFGKYE